MEMTGRDTAAERLARGHYAIEPGIMGIYRIEKPGEGEVDPDDPIALLEINQFTLPYGVVPVFFRAHPASGIDYASEIIELTPDEFEILGTPALPLPEGWRIGKLIARASVAEDVPA